MAMHIADAEGSASVKRILSNLSMLFEDSSDPNDATYDTFKAYIASHWRQVLLLFVNHPSMECRALGYKVLSLSQMWDYKGQDPVVISKLLMDAWFRHMKNRYMWFWQEDEKSVLDELENLSKYMFYFTFRSLVN